jgi:hypothetical protein
MKLGAVLALLACLGSAAHAETALLYVRPVVAGTHGRTRFESLAEANALTAPLRNAIGAGQKVLSQQELDALLPERWRPQMFDCRERLGCLAPMLALLFKNGLRTVYFATVELDADGLELTVHRVSLKPYRFDGSSAMRLRRNPAPSEDELRKKLRKLLGGAEPEEESRAGARPRPEEPPAQHEPPKPEARKPEPPKPTPPPVDNGEDVVETMDVMEAAATPAKVNAPSPPPPAPDVFRIGGWARASLEAGFVDGQYKNPKDPYALPHEPLIARGQLFARAKYSRGRWFEAQVSGLLSYGLFERGPANATDSFNGFNGQQHRNVLEGTLYEASIGFFSKYFDFRIGQQRVAWGRGDIFSPNDVVNARDTRDPLLAEPETLHLPTLLLRGDIDLRRFGIIQLLYAPFFVPDKFDVYGTNWAALQPGAPMAYRGFFNLAATDPTLQPIVGAGEQQIAQRYDFTDAELGARYSLSIGNTDLSAYYHWGFDRMPTFSVDPQAAMLLNMVDFNTVMPGQLAGIPMILGKPPFTAGYTRRHHAGADAATLIGPVALRFEAAYDTSRVFYQTDLNSFVSGALQLAAAVEYQTGDPGKVVLFEVTYLHIVDTPPVPLLVWSQDTAALGTNIRWTFFRRLELELRGGIGVQPFTYVLRPQIAVKVGELSFRLGALILGGDDRSFGGYFSGNKSLYTMIKYSF